MHTTVGLGSMDFKGSSPLVGDVVETVGSRVSIGVSLGDDEGDFKMTKIRDCKEMPRCKCYNREISNE